MSAGHSLNESIDSKDEANNNRFSIDNMFAMEVEEIPQYMKSNIAVNNMFAGVDQPSRRHLSASSDIEYLKFLNFNTSTASTSRYDFEITEKKPPSSSSENEDEVSKRSRSNEKQRKQAFVTGGDIRRLFGDEKFVGKKEDKMDRCLTKKSLQKKETEFQSRIENEIFEENTSQGKRVIIDQCNVGIPVNRCSCSKSKCMKMYCTCYSNGIPCTQLCSCRECLNNDKISRKADSKHPKNDNCCNCKMTYCEKNYCTCARSQKGCSPQCTCYSCKNIFGIRPKKTSHLSNI